MSCETSQKMPSVLRPRRGNFCKKRVLYWKPEMWAPMAALKFVL
jgi:hypothetical protein